MLSFSSPTLNLHFSFNNKSAKSSHIFFAIPTVFLVFKTLKYKLNSDSKLKSPEKYENHQFISIDNNVDKSNELYDYALELLVKQIRSSGLKKVLSDLESYVGELKAQAKSIVKLSDVKDDPELKKLLVEEMAKKLMTLNIKKINDNKYRCK